MRQAGSWYRLYDNPVTESPSSTTTACSTRTTWASGSPGSSWSRTWVRCRGARLQRAAV